VSSDENKGYVMSETC